MEIGALSLSKRHTAAATTSQTFKTKARATGEPKRSAAAWRNGSLCSRRGIGRNRAQNGSIASLRHLDNQQIAFSLVCIVIPQARAEARGLGSHDRILFGIVVCSAAKYLDGHDRFLNIPVAPLQMLLYDESQESCEAFIT